MSIIDKTLMHKTVASADACAIFTDVACTIISMGTAVQVVVCGSWRIGLVEQVAVFSGGAPMR